MARAPVSVVVPMRDEAHTVVALLEGLARQQPPPAELVFVDTGSRDGSAERVRDWWAASGWAEASCRMLEEKGAYPGAGRNAGVRASGQPWIAFIDCGIVPEPGWLGALIECAKRTGAEAVLGNCRFEADGAWPRAFCALSYGVGTRRVVLPASLFRRTLVDEAGPFDPALRAGEDVAWLQAIAQRGRELMRCEEAQVVYRHFPRSLLEAAGKWYDYERSLSAAGAGGWPRRLAVLAPLSLYVLPFAAPLAGAILWAGYLALRGVLDPIRRSVRREWWRGAPLAPACAPLAALAIDTGRAFGCLVGLVARSP